MDFAVKYRPRLFADICGNKENIALLKRLIKVNKLPDFIILSGQPGTGKTTSNFVIIKADMCKYKTEDGEPCDSCESCKGINDSLFNNGKVARGLNIFNYDMGEDSIQDANIESIRNLLSAPNYNKKYDRYIIINELHNCNVQRQQRLLDPLENIPAGTHVICTTSDYQSKIAKGIKSRGKHFQMVNPSKSEVVDRLKQVSNIEKIKVTKKELEVITNIKENNLRESLNVLEMVKFAPEEAWTLLMKTYKEGLEELIKYLDAVRGGVIDLINYIQGVDNKSSFIKELPNLLSKAIELKYCADGIVEPSVRKTINEKTRNLSDKVLIEVNEKLLHIPTVTESDASRLMLIIGFKLNENMFMSIERSDIENSIDKEATSDIKGEGYVFYNNYTVESVEESQSNELTDFEMLSTRQNIAGEVRLEDILGTDVTVDEILPMPNIDLKDILGE